MTAAQKKLKGEQEIESILNSIEALCLVMPHGMESPKQVMEELASRLEQKYPNVHQWVVQRRYKPNAAAILEMKDWVEITCKALTRSEKITYRKALAKIEKERT